MARVVSFRLGPDQFGVEAAVVERVLRYTPPRVLPRLPDWVDGVIDYDGQIVPVVDLRRRFELAPLATSGAKRILVLQLKKERLGVVVDAVTDVLELAESDISRPPPFFRGLASAYLKGLARASGGLLVLLDPEELMASQERIVFVEAGLSDDAAQRA